MAHRASVGARPLSYRTKYSTLTRSVDVSGRPICVLTRVYMPTFPCVVDDASMDAVVDGRESRVEAETVNTAQAMGNFCFARQE